jgi:hypothetical protein
LGLTAAVWAITARVLVSTFSTALQQGQVTSKAGALLAIVAHHTAKAGLCAESDGCGSPGSAPEFDGKNVEQVQHLPSQQKNRKQNYNDGHQFSEAETSSRRFEAPCRQT